MSETKDAQLTTQVPIGLNSESPNALQDSLNKLWSSLPSSQLLQEQKKVIQGAEAEMYKEILSPDYSETAITEQGERNRQILLWSIQKGIRVPGLFRHQDSYTKITTQELIQTLLNEDQLQQLQGAMVLSVLERYSQKDVDPNNTIAYGGVVYSQAPIDDGEDGIIAGSIVKQFANRSFQEPGITPGFLRKNVRGTVHVLPYGVNRKIPGKEKETLLMLVADMLAVIEYFDKHPQNMGYPRFVLNGTNSTMGNLAEKHLGAQVKKASDIEGFLSSLTHSLKPGNPDTVAVFMSEKDLREGKIKLRKLKERMSSGKEDSRAESLKKIRAEAIGYISQELNFVDRYKKSHPSIVAA